MLVGPQPSFQRGQPGICFSCIWYRHTMTLPKAERDQYPYDAVPRKLIRMRPRPNEPGRCGAKRRRADLFDEIKQAHAPILALPPDLLIQVSLQDVVCANASRNLSWTAVSWTRNVCHSGRPLAACTGLYLHTEDRFPKLHCPVLNDYISRLMCLIEASQPTKLPNTCMCCPQVFHNLSQTTQRALLPLVCRQWQELLSRWAT